MTIERPAKLIISDSRFDKYDSATQYFLAVTINLTTLLS